MKTNAKVAYAIVSVAALFIGFLVSSVMIEMGKKPAEQKPTPEPPVLPIVHAEVTSMNDVVVGFGSAQVKTKAQLVPEVSGVISSVSPSFMAGASFKMGDILVTLKADDYLAGKAQASAALNQAQANKAQAEAMHAQAQANVISASAGIELAKARKLQADQAELQANEQIKDAAAAISRSEQEKLRAEAVVTQAQARVTSESALAELAKEEWDEYARRERAAGRDPGQPNDLVLRTTQLAEAQATLNSANAGVLSATSGVTSAKANLARITSMKESAAKGIIVAEQEVRSAIASKSAAEAMVESAAQSVNAAQAAIDAALETEKTAQLNLDRCELRAPFDGRIASIMADLGERVSLGQPIAMLYANEAMDIHVPVSLEDMAFVQLSKEAGMNASESSTCRVVYDFGGMEHTVEKVAVIGTEAAIDDMHRTLNVIVRIPSPFDLQAPLLQGTFCRVEFTSPSPAHRGKLPRRVLRSMASDVMQERYPTTRQWAVVATLGEVSPNPDYQYATLHYRPVELIRTEGQMAFIADYAPTGSGESERKYNVGQGELVLATTLVPVTEGMRIRVKTSELGAAPAPANE